MSKSFDRARSCALVAAALAAAVLPQLARGEDGQCPVQAAAQARIGIPILDNVPYFGRLFRVVGYSEEACADGHACPDDFERIGVDFEFCQDGQCPLAIRLVDFAKCEECKGEACKCEGGKCDDCKACCAAGECLACSACKCSAAKTACACGTTCACDHKCACGHKDECGETCYCAAQHVAGCPALFEHLLTLTAKSAALEAKLEARTEHAELVSEMLELAQENAKLKAQVELAEAKAEMAQHVLTVTLENEQLKSKLAELTSKLESDNVRAAERSNVQHPATPR
jgi:hypothetical protein